MNTTTTTDDTRSAAREVSAWAPLRERVFAVMWVASVVGATGTWIRDVGAGWLMTSLSPSATLVALVQVATTLPVFLLSLPGGVLADLLDRRRFLVAANLLLLVVASFMWLATTFGVMTPAVLIASLLAAGIVSALLQPVQQSLTPLMVPRALLRPAVALNSMGFNVARAIGPAIAGALIAAFGVAFNFLIDALSYLAPIAAFWWWKAGAARASTGVPERPLAAMRAGVRYALHSAPLKRTLLRASSYFIYASALWALLPLIARRELGGGPAYYGAVLACIGAGAVAGAVALPSLRRRLGSEGVMRCGMVATIVALAALAVLKDRVAAAAAMALVGAAWIAVLTTANVAAQSALPDWVRGRGLAIYLTAFYGTMTAGSLLWGAIADHVGIPVALAVAAGVGLASLLLALARPLPEGDPDLTPSMHWPEPALSPEMQDALEHDRGPVLVMVEYLVGTADRTAFLAALSEFKGERLRDGAIDWGVYEDADQPGRFVEHFLVPSWLEHLRQHQRVSKADAELQARVARYHLGHEPPRVRHLIAPRF